MGLLAGVLLLPACGRTGFLPEDQCKPEVAEPPACAAPCSAPQTCGGGGTPGVCGASYYVDPVAGGDARSGLSPADAWSTFSRALPALTPGDALVLQDGLYTA